MCRGNFATSTLLNPPNNAAQVLLSRLQIEGLEEEQEFFRSSHDSERAKSSTETEGGTGGEASARRGNRFYSPVPPVVRPAKEGPGEDGGSGRDGQSNGGES